MSQDQNISQHVSTEKLCHSHHQGFGEGAFAKGGGSVFPWPRVVRLSLGLLNALLLIAAVSIGIYCAKAKDLQVPYSDATPFIIERNYLRSNHSEMIRAKVEIQAAVMRERAKQLLLLMEVKQQKVAIDILQRQIETLETERTFLKNNRTALEESCGRCLLKWVLLKSSCYYFSQPESNSKKNWPDSRADCMSRGGDLVVINNLDEQIIVNSNIPQPSTSSSLWWQNSFWIGLTDVVAHGTWVWLNNVTEVETMYWKDGQPNYRGVQSGNCAASYHYSDTRRTWLNGDCHDHQLNWICEMQPK